MSDAPASTEVVTTQRQRSVLNDMAERYGMEPKPFEQTVMAICMPPKSTREQFAAFLLVAKEYRLNPLTKEIYAFPAKGGGIVPIVSIDGWISLVNSHPACDGFSFAWEQDGKGDPISCTRTMYRKDRSHPVVVTEYLVECIRPTEPWKMKHRMLRHKTMIQSARYAFGFSGIYDEDEGQKIADAPAPQTVRSSSPPPPPDETEEDATDVEAFDPDAFAATIIAAVAASPDEEALVKMWEELQVDTALLEHGDLLDEVYEVRNRRIAMFDGDVTDEPEGEQTDEPFPGDEP